MIQTQSFSRQKKTVKNYVDCFRSVFLTFLQKVMYWGDIKEVRTSWCTTVNKGKEPEEKQTGEKNHIEEHRWQSLSTQNELTLT